MSETFATIRKEMCIAVLKRADTVDAKRTEASKIARNYFLGASNLALLISEKDLAHELHSSYTAIVERGVGLVYKWAEMVDPALGEKEAA